MIINQMSAMYGKKNNNGPESGFTLVELMIVVLLSGLIAAAVYSVYRLQQRSYTVQEDVVEMQQNIRAGLDALKRELRAAGFDPTRTAGAGIITASPGYVQFSQDINNDGDTADAGEIVEFGFALAIDADRNGIPDALAGGIPVAAPLGVQFGGAAGAAGYQAIAENIQAVEFSYLDAAGAVTAVLADIRSVQVSILARARFPDQNFNHGPTVYTTPSGQNWGPYNDNFRRRFLTTRIRCRNLGL